MSQNPPDNPFGSQPPDDPFGKPPEDEGPQSAADIWRRASEQQQRQPPPPPPPPPGPLPPPEGYYAGPPVGARKADGAITSLVLGILGIVLCPLCAPFAWSLGRKAERQVDASGGMLGGRGEATAGKILGIIGTAFIVLGIIFLIIFILGIAALDGGGGTVTTFDEF